MPSLLVEAPVKEIVAQAELSAAGQEACAAETKADSALARLEERECIGDAVAFLAHALPKREAVWWALLCLWDVQRPEASARDEAVYRALVRWLRQPSEESRRQVETAGKAAGVKSLAGNLARAAFLSGGSMSRAGLPKVMPAPHQTAVIVRKILRAASTRANPLKSNARLKMFLCIGRQVAEEKNRWTP